MAMIAVRIGADGSMSPSQIQVNAGDTVGFEAEADAVLCVDPDSLFGEERYEIAEKTTVSLTVQPNPPGIFQFITRMGDLNAPCMGPRDKTGSGGGGTGGGPD